MKWIWYLIFALYAFSTGCIKKGDLNFKNMKVDNWTPDWALPLVSANMNLQSLVKTSDVLTIDASGLYTLHYTAPLFALNAADFVKIPDQSFTTPVYKLHSGISSLSYTGTVSDSGSSASSFVDTNGARLNHVVFGSGNIQLLISNTFHQNISLRVVFPNITKGGASLSINSTITYPATTSTINADLSGYTIDLTNGGSTFNYMAYQFYFTLTGTGQPIDPGNYIAGNIFLTGLHYSFMDGFLGHYTIPIPDDTIGVNVFNNNIDANIFLLNPTLSLEFTNSLGLSVSATLDSVFGITNKNQKKSFTMPAITLNGAASLGSDAITDFTIDSSNSSIQYMFNPGPNHVVYQGFLSFNPGLTSGYNFISDTSRITLSAKANLPACLKIITLSLGDTTKLILPTDTSLVQSADFRLLMDNGLPLYGSLQVYFADGNYVILDSLIKPNINVLKAAPVDGNGIVTNHTPAITDFIMEHDRYNAMAPKVKYAIIVANLYSSGTSTVQILNTNYLNVKLACRFMLNVPQGTL